MIDNQNDIEMYGEKEVRWYQASCRGAVEQALENGDKRILVVLPTGAGKTITSGLIFSSDRVRKALGVPEGEKLRLLFVAHKHRLLTQAERAYADAAGVEFIEQSAFSDIPQELIEEGWHITCLDEAHHEAMMTLQLQLEYLGEKPIIGLTATPDRADGCVIKFENIIEPITREQAVAEGWLAETELNSFIDTPMKDKTDIIKDIIGNFGNEFGQTMVFVRTKAEVSRITDFLNENGYAAIGILNQSEQELNNILDDFSAKKFQFVVNCNKINEGVDVVGCTDVLLGRQFGSYPQLNQVIGRASRPDSECRVWELINPLSGTNLDTTVVVGTPKRHRLLSKTRGSWVSRLFDYVSSGGRAIETGLRAAWSTQ